VPLNGFRIDHALASAPLAGDATRCYYSHAERESRLSDHSALLVEFTAVQIPVERAPESDETTL
jgi:exonuclease III